MISTVYLVRHAHADWNPDEDRPLSARGRASADRLCDLLAGLPIEALYSSPARRAVETIEPLARRLRLEPTIVHDLRERELVVPAGADFESAVRSAWLAPAEARPGSESNERAQTRGAAVIRTILQKQRGQHTVVSTHGNLLALVLNGLEPALGFEFWRSLTFPDVYELKFQEAALSNVRRIWTVA